MGWGAQVVNTEHLQRANIVSIQWQDKITIDNCDVRCRYCRNKKYDANSYPVIKPDGCSAEKIVPEAKHHGLSVSGCQQKYNDVNCSVSVWYTWISGTRWGSPGCSISIRQSTVAASEHRGFYGSGVCYVKTFFKEGFPDSLYLENNLLFFERLKKKSIKGVLGTERFPIGLQNKRLLRSCPLYWACPTGLSRETSEFLLTSLFWHWKLEWGGEGAEWPWNKLGKQQISLLSQIAFHLTVPVLFHSLERKESVKNYFHQLSSESPPLPSSSLACGGS